MIERISYKPTSIALLVMALHAPGARADDDADTPMFSFSGFGTLGAVHSSEDQADFTSTPFKPNGAGHTRAWSADVDSRIAAQVTANFTPQLSAVLQAIAGQNYDNSYRPHVEWANIQYQITPDFSIRAGRIVLPVFLLTDTLNVGYTYPWVRPPIEVYRLLPVSNNDGLDFSYRLHLGEMTNTVQAGIGKSDVKLINSGGTAEARDAWGFSNTLEYGSFTAHVTYRHARLTVPSVNALFDAFRLFGPQGIAIADKYGSDDKPNSVIAVGVSYDPGNWFVMSEWGQGDANAFLGKRDAWYVSGGYRFGRFTPYVIYARANADNLSDPGLAAPGAAGLNAALNSILSTKPVQDTVSIGGRWDFMKNADLKLQFDHTDIGAGSSGVLSNLQPGFQPGGKVNVFSATLDFVF